MTITISVIVVFTVFFQVLRGGEEVLFDGRDGAVGVLFDVRRGRGTALLLLLLRLLLLLQVAILPPLKANQEPVDLQDDVSRLAGESPS